MDAQLPYRVGGAVAFAVYNSQTWYAWSDAFSLAQQNCFCIHLHGTCKSGWLRLFNHLCSRPPWAGRGYIGSDGSRSSTEPLVCPLLFLTCLSRGVAPQTSHGTTV